MSDEVQKPELLPDGNTETETFGDYIDKYRTLNQQIVSARCQIQLLKDHDNRYEMHRFARLIPQLYDTLSGHILEMENAALAIGHAMAWVVEPEDRKIVSDIIFSNRPLTEIVREHSVSERCIRNLIQEYSQISIPRNLINEYLEKSKRKQRTGARNTSV